MDKERTGMLLLSKEDIKNVITMKDMIEADKQAFKMVVDGTVDTPLRTVINGKYAGLCSGIRCSSHEGDQHFSTQYR